MKDTKVESINEISSNEKIKPFLSTLIDSAVIIAMITGVLYLVSFFLHKAFKKGRWSAQKRTASVLKGTS